MDWGAVVVAVSTDPNWHSNPPSANCQTPQSGAGPALSGRPARTARRAADGRPARPGRPAIPRPVGSITTTRGSRAAAAIHLRGRVGAASDERHQLVRPAGSGPDLPHERRASHAVLVWSHQHLGDRQARVGRDRQLGRTGAARHQLARRARPPSPRCRCTAPAAAPAARARPRRSAPAASARSRELAATPPPSSRCPTPCSRAARTALAVSTSATASWNDAATSADRHRLAGPLAGLDPARDRGLQPRERERERRIVRAGHPARERDRAGSTLAGQPVDRRPARERQPEQPGHLVERLAGRVVDGRAELDHLLAADLGHEQHRRVPARHQQRDARLVQRAVLEQVDSHVRAEVVHPVQRLVPARARTPWRPRPRPAARRPGPDRRSPPPRRGRTGAPRPRRAPVGPSAPSPRDAPGWRPRARLRRSARARRRCSRSRRRAGSCRARCRPRSRRRMSRCRGPAPRSWLGQLQLHRQRVDPAVVVVAAAAPDGRRSPRADRCAARRRCRPARRGTPR